MSILEVKNQSWVQRSLLLLPRWVTPNGVTVFRALLAIPVFLLIAAKSFWLATVILTVALILDFVDGALAAVRDMRSETGAFLDPLADKIVICGVLFALTPAETPFLLGLTLTITAIAALLTASRVVKLALVRYDRLPKETSVAASAAGKLKMTLETTGVIALMIARGDLFTALLSPYFEGMALLLLIFSLRYALPSLVGQLRGLAPAFRSR